MRPITEEWVQKAEQDFRSAKRESRAEADAEPNYDLTVYLCGQSAEKYLKARLKEAGLPAPYIHDLSDILDLVLPLEPMWTGLRGSLNRLNDDAVQVRYPGWNAGIENAEEAIETASAVRKVVRKALGLTP